VAKGAGENRQKKRVQTRNKDEPLAGVGSTASICLVPLMRHCGYAEEKKPSGG